MMQGIPNLYLLQSSEQGVCTQILDATFPGFPNSPILPLFKTTQLKLAFICSSYFSLSPRINVQFNLITPGIQKGSECKTFQKYTAYEYKF